MKCFGSSPKAYRCKIVLLDETELIQEIKDTYKGLDILEIVFKHLSLLETVYFGLRFVNAKGHSCWLQSGKNIIRQVKGIEPITFYFGVKFYASDPCKLLEEGTSNWRPRRYQFFLQIKQDIQQSRLPVTSELAAQLLAYIIQSELGDYDPRTHQLGYVSEFHLVANQSVEFETKVCDLHKKLIGQTPAAVEMLFLERIKWLDMYGCELHPVIAEDRHEYFLGLTPHGIVVLKNKFKIGNYFWPSIGKVFRKGKYFMIKAIDKNNEQNTYGFEMPDQHASEYIYKSCKQHKEFFNLSQNSDRFRSANHHNVLLTSSSSRPAPSLVRVPSRRYQRMRRPDGSDGLSDGYNKENDLDFKPNAISRHNSTPSLSLKAVPVNHKYSSPYNMNEKRERGLFSKSASASPLSVRSAFVSRYDYGNAYYVSPMKRNSSSLSLQRVRAGRISDNESEVSKCSRSSRHSNHKCRRRHHDGSETESNSSRRHRSRRRPHNTSKPQMVEWNDVLEKGKEAHRPPTTGIKHSSAVVKNVNEFKVYPGQESDFGSMRHFDAKNSPNYQLGNKYFPPEVRRYIEREPIDSSNLSENEKKSIPYTKVESESRIYKIHHSNLSNGLQFKLKKMESNDADENDSESKHNGFFNGSPRGDYATNYNKSSNAYYDKNLNYPRQYDSYYFNQRNGKTNADQMPSPQSAPRVTFQSAHSTAYFTNQEVYQSKPAMTMNGHKEAGNRPYEMSTEL